MDFTIKKYRELIQVFKDNYYDFQNLNDYLENPAKRVIILRHDVENKYVNSFTFAEFENSVNISGSYYFRYSKGGFDKSLIKRISVLGHEIGYHYDDLSSCKGNVKGAISRFSENLKSLREVAKVTTITKEGSPLSPFNNALIWNKIDYKDFGVVCEPYRDLDFTDIFYLTDTGRKWNGYNVSFRDKIPEMQKLWIKKGQVYHSTDDIIRAIRMNTFPEKVLITFHPQRWTNNICKWILEYLSQTARNIVKYIILLFKREII